MFNGTNFKTWKENVMIVLGIFNLDYALMIDRPTCSHEEKEDMKNWDRSNHISLMIMKRIIPKVFKSTLSKRSQQQRIFLTNLRNDLLRMIRSK